MLVWRRLSCFFHCADPACKNTNLFADVQIAFRCVAAVSDNRIVEGIEAVARAGNLYYIVIRDASILFFIVIAIVCASTSFMGG